MACLDGSQIEGLAYDRLPPEAKRLALSHVAGCVICSRAVAHEQKTAMAKTLGANMPEGPGEVAVAIGAGERIGPYQVLERLGEGGMGAVYSAYHRQLDRVVALKVIAPGVSTSEEQQSRLMREAVAMAKLAHPNVVAIHDVGTFRGNVYLVMDRIQGQNLAEWVLAKKRPEREVLRAFLEAGKGLAAAHAAGIVHRDFKPGNILVSKEGRVLVTDFGLARAVNDVVDTLPARPRDKAVLPPSPLATPLTQAGLVIGTPEYMSPEQVTGRAADPRSDQFAFCVALFEAFYGKRPYADVTDPNLHALGELPSKRGVPRAVKRALERGLNLDPAKRFPSMADLLAVLSNTSLATDLRVEASVRVAQIRMAGVALFLGLAIVLGRVYGAEDWRVYELPLAGYGAAAGLVLALLRRERARAFLDFFGPLADCAAIGWVQGLSIPVSPHPSGVAGWSLGLFVVIVVLSALPLRVPVVLLTTLAAWAAEGMLQRMAAVGWGAVGASGIVLGMAGAAMIWVILRLDGILAEWATSRQRAKPQRAAD